MRWYRSREHCHLVQPHILPSEWDHYGIKNVFAMQRHNGAISSIANVSLYWFSFNNRQCVFGCRYRSNAGLHTWVCKWRHKAHSVREGCKVVDWEGWPPAGESSVQTIMWIRFNLGKLSPNDGGIITRWNFQTVFLARVDKALQKKQSIIQFVIPISLKPERVWWWIIWLECSSLLFQAFLSWDKC